MFKDILNGQKFFGELIAVIINTILLSFVYFIGVGGTSIIAKISKKKFLEKEIGLETYWTDSEPIPIKLEDCYKQF